jgi:signal peptidase II
MKTRPNTSNARPQAPQSGFGLFLAALPVYGLAALLFALDQLSKSWIASRLPLGASQPWLGDWLYLTHVQNQGAAFSLFDGQKLVLSTIALLVIAGIVVYERRLQQRSWLQLAAMGCILAGAIGNLTDRLRLGHVVDFFDLHVHGRNIWPIFNVADISINLGVALLILFYWRHTANNETAKNGFATTPAGEGISSSGEAGPDIVDGDIAAGGSKEERGLTNQASIKS